MKVTKAICATQYIKDTKAALSLTFNAAIFLFLDINISG